MMSSKATQSGQRIWNSMSEHRFLAIYPILIRYQIDDGGLSTDFNMMRIKHITYHQRIRAVRVTARDESLEPWGGLLVYPVKYL